MRHEVYVHELQHLLPSIRHQPRIEMLFKIKDVQSFPIIDSRSLVVESGKIYMPPRSCNAVNHPILPFGYRRHFLNSLSRYELCRAEVESIERHKYASFPFPYIPIFPYQHSTVMIYTPFVHLIVANWQPTPLMQIIPHSKKVVMVGLRMKLQWQDLHSRIPARS